MSTQEQSLPGNSKQADEAVGLTLTEKEEPILAAVEHDAGTAAVASEAVDKLESNRSVADANTEHQPSSATKNVDNSGTLVEPSGISKSPLEMAAGADVHPVVNEADRTESISTQKSSSDHATSESVVVKDVATEEEPNKDVTDSSGQKPGTTPATEGSAAENTDANTKNSMPNTRPSTSRSTAAGSNTDSISVHVEGDNNEVSVLQIERPRVQVYGSTVSGNRTYKKQAKELFMMLEANEVDFEFICIAADEKAKNYMRRKSRNNMTIPQIYVDTEFKGFYEDAFKANEIDELYEWLGLDEDPLDY
ncbi:hypothetical protein H4S08_003953 [Coemansia sp. RSA 1365]|nr:hypothetical protein H4S08_003953 [Coemansia sp. RSA 1365]